MKNDFISPDVPNPYTAGVKQLRAAAATPATNFEDEWKSARTRELARERDEINARIAARPRPRFTAAELAACAAPDPYAAGIKALQSKDKR